MALLTLAPAALRRPPPRPVATGWLRLGDRHGLLGRIQPPGMDGGGLNMRLTDHRVRPVSDRQEDRDFPARCGHFLPTPGRSPSRSTAPPRRRPDRLPHPVPDADLRPRGDGTPG